MIKDSQNTKAQRWERLAHSIVVTVSLFLPFVALLAGNLLGGSRYVFIVSERMGRLLAKVLPAYSQSTPQFFVTHGTSSDYSQVRAALVTQPQGDAIEKAFLFFEKLRYYNIDPFWRPGLSPFDFEFPRWYALAWVIAITLAIMTRASDEARLRFSIIRETSTFVGRLSLNLLLASPLLLVVVAAVRPWAWMWGRAADSSGFTAPINYAYPLTQTVIACVASLIVSMLLCTKILISRKVLAPRRVPRRYSRCFDCGFTLEQQPRCPECGRTDPGMESPTILTSAGSWLRQRLTHRQSVLLTLGVLVGLWLMPLLLGLAGIR